MVLGRLGLSVNGFPKLKVCAGGAGVFAALLPNEKVSGVAAGAFSDNVEVLPNEKDNLGSSAGLGAAAPPNENKLEELSLLSTGRDPKENFAWSLVGSVDDGFAPKENKFEAAGFSVVVLDEASPNEKGLGD